MLGMRQAAVWMVVGLLAAACASTGAPAPVIPSPSPGEEDSASPGAGTPSVSVSQSVNPGAVGAIAGRLAYPSEFLPGQLVYAVNTDGVEAFSSESAGSQGSYSIQGVSAGSYYVYSTVRPVKVDNGTVVGAVYSEFVTCGLSASCPSHKPIAVRVSAGKTTIGVDVTDWYTPDGRVPAPPMAVVVTDPSLVPLGISYPSASAAGLGLMQSQERAIVVDAMSQCPQNLACMSLGREVAGTGADYFLGQAGSNTDLVACGAYVVGSGDSFVALRRACGARVWPDVGAVGTVNLGLGATGCAHVRTTPGGAVVGCVGAGASVKVDGGPYAAPLAGSDGVWWHVAGKGWMADDFLH